MGTVGDTLYVGLLLPSSVPEGMCNPVHEELVQCINDVCHPI